MRFCLFCLGVTWALQVDAAACKKQQQVRDRATEMQHYTEAEWKSYNEFKAIVESFKPMKDTWYDKTCSRWQLGGDWSSEEKRKIHVGFLFNDEFPILDVLLYEIYPVVDYIILVEFDKTFAGHDKPLHFEAHKDAYAKFKDKLIHIPVRVRDEDDTTVAQLTAILLNKEYKAKHEEVPKNIQAMYSRHSKMPLEAAAVKMRRDVMYTPEGRKWIIVPDYNLSDTNANARWEMQMSQRKVVSDASLHQLGLGDDDIFMYGDVDEVISREFLEALKHCDPIPEIANDVTKCAKRAVKSFGFTYHLNRTERTAKNKPDMAFHPDYTIGRCMKDINGLFGWEAHDIREADVVILRQKREKENRFTYDMNGWLNAEWVGIPAGWHFYSFTTTVDLFNEQSMRAGQHFDEAASVYYGCNRDEIIQTINADRRATTTPGTSVNVFGNWKMPHAIEDFPEKFPFFLGVVDDDAWPEWGSATSPLPVLQY